VHALLTFADFGFFRQRHGKEVCRNFDSGVADHSTAAVHHQDWRNVLLHLRLDLHTRDFSGESRTASCVNDTSLPNL